MIKVEKLNPFGRMCVSLGMLPSSYKESLTYEEQLLWFFKYLDETVIPTVNNNADAVEELQALYLQIKTYVDEYFDNLDVQEEINNKLDDMAESGQLTDIIAQYLQLAGVLAYNTVADMKTANNLVDGSICKTLGYHSLNDGGAAFYKIREITNADIVDEMTILSLEDNTLIAELIKKDMMPIECFGAYGDGTHDDSDALEKACSLGITVLFGLKDYKINRQITLNKSCKLLGSCIERETERKYIDFTSNNDNECFILNVKGIIFENLNFKGVNTKHIGFTIENKSRYTFKNCGFYYFNKAIYTNRAWSTSFYDCVFEYNNTCVEFNNVNTSFLFSGTIFYSSTNGIVSNQELDYSNIIGGGFDHVDTCINLTYSNYANNITLTNVGIEDYIIGIRCIGNSNATVISSTFVNTERSTDTYIGAGKITVINGRSDTALTPNKNDVIYITPILGNNAKVSTQLTSNGIKTIYNTIGNTKFYDFTYTISNGNYFYINYEESTECDIELSVCSTAYPETYHITKYSTTVAKTQGTPSTFTFLNDTDNNRVVITFNRNCNIRVTGYIKNGGSIS